MARIYVNRSVVAANQKTGERAAPITVAHKGKRYPAHDIEIHGRAHVIYRPDNPLSSGARIWIQCDEPHCRIVIKPSTKTPR